MEVLQGCSRNGCYLAQEQQQQQHQQQHKPRSLRRSSHATSSRPLVLQSLGLSSRRFNPLSCKLPRGGGGCAGRVVMAVEEAYAAALAQVAKAKNAMDEVYADAEKLCRYFDKPEVMKFFSNPVMEEDKKKEVLRKMAEEEKLQACTLNFLLVLVDKRRMGIVKQVLEVFESKYYEMTDTQVAIVTSAVKIPGAQLAQIAKKVQELSGAKNVKIKNVVDESVIAGFSVKYGPGGSLFIDLTVKGELDRIAALLEAPQEAAPVPAGAA